jgi:Zn-dependent protease with chaperone function
LNELVTSSKRRVEYSAVTAFAPVLALFPVWLAAVALLWIPFNWLFGVPFTHFAIGEFLFGIVLFSRPVQRLLFVRLLGARQPTEIERAHLESAWKVVEQQAGIRPGRFVLSVADVDDINAFACGGHMLVVSAFSIEHLTEDELTGVLAHELSHHLGGHTVALTIAQWMSMPILGLAQLGIRVRDIGLRISKRLEGEYPTFKLVGWIINIVLTSLSRVLLIGFLLAQSLGEIVGRSAEFQADRRAHAMGFGRELRYALTRVIHRTPASEPTRFLSRVLLSHPPAIDRVARLDAMLNR